MRAVWYERTGAANEVLKAGEQPLPEPGPGEVRVRLKTSGVNPADTYRRRGEGYAMEAPLVIPNSDGAGIIDKVGPGIDAKRIGERVWIYNGQRGRPLGTAAEAIALDADLVTRLPDDVSFEAGACLGIPCMTAHRCVFSEGETPPLERGHLSGKTVLVTGGGGAVGNYAIQLAKWAGARVLDDRQQRYACRRRPGRRRRSDPRSAHGRPQGGPAQGDRWPGRRPDRRGRFRRQSGRHRRLHCLEWHRCRLCHTRRRHAVRADPNVHAAQRDDPNGRPE